MSTEINNEVAICNLALSHLGQAPITNLLNPATNVEQLCALQYAICRDSLQEDAEWTFCTAMERLDAVTDTLPLSDEVNPLGQWFEVPDAIRILMVYKGHGSPLYPHDLQTEWYLQDGYLACNYEKITVKYLKKTTVVQNFSAQFKQVLAYKIALALCIPITENVGLMQSLKAMYDELMDKAALNDGLQGTSNNVTFRRLTNVR